MKREILFRAKRLDNGEWAEGYVSKPGFTDVEGNIESYFFNVVDELGWISECEVFAETVCEYTGLADKNGRKIFERDIVKREMFGGFSFGEVVWLDVGFCGFELKTDITSYYPIGKDEYTGKSDSDEVVGNIFDNPELLEGD